MTKITIISKGIGIIYQKDNKWKEIFPVNDCHKVKFSYEGGPAPEDWAGKNRKIIITTDKEPSTAIEGTDYDKFVDITANSFHGKGVKTSSGWEERGVLMEIDNAVLSVNELTLSRYNLLDANENLVKEMGEVGFSAKAEINLEPRGFVQITLTENGTEIKSKTFNSADGDVTITFDNDCYQDTNIETGDFEMIYKVLDDDDPQHLNRKFKIDRHPDDKFNSRSKNPGVFGNRSTNPIPKAFGLPCHKVVINKVDESKLP